MALVTKNTAENLIIVLVAVMFFQTVPKLPFVGEYIAQQPLILLGLAVVIAVFMNRILNALKFIDRQTLKGFLVLLVSFLAFHSIPKFEIVKQYINAYTVIIFIVALMLLALKDKLADLIGG